MTLAEFAFRMVLLLSSASAGETSGRTVQCGRAPGPIDFPADVRTVSTVRP